MSRVKQISKRFSEAAEYYHQNAHVQRQISEDTAALLGRERLLGQCLDLGCGSGFLGGKLAAENPGLEVLGIDVAAGMIRHASEKYAAYSNIHFEVRDAVNGLPLGAYDYLVSSSSLQWMYPFDETISLWMAALKPSGRLAISFMVPGTLAELRKAREEATRLESLEFLPTLEEVVAAVTVSGGGALSSFQRDYAVRYPDADSLLDDLRCLGVNAPLRDIPEPKLTVDEFGLLKMKLDGIAAVEGGINLTYVVGFITATKLGSAA